MFLDTGLRLTELVTIKLEKLTLDSQLVKIVSKDGDVDLVPFGSLTARDLDRYLRVGARHSRSHLPNLWLGVNAASIGSNGIYQTHPPNPDPVVHEGEIVRVRVLDGLITEYARAA